MKAVIGLGEIKELLKTDKAVKAVLIAGAALIIMLALGGLFGGKTVKNTDKAVNNAAELEKYEHGLEERLAAILSDIDGVGKAKVMVTLDTSGRTEYGKNCDMLISVTAPAVRGVIVVCDGGDSITVREKVTGAVSGVFGINTLHISVSGSRQQ